MPKSSKARYSTQLNKTWTTSSQPALSPLKIQSHANKQAYERRERESFRLVIFYASHTPPKIIIIDDCRAFPKFSLAERAGYLLLVGISPSDATEVYDCRYRFWTEVSLDTVLSVNSSPCLIIRRNSDIVCDNLHGWITDIQEAARLRSPVLWDNVGAERAKVSASYKSGSHRTSKKRNHTELDDLSETEDNILKRLRGELSTLHIPSALATHA
ncbi:uncharacterized protein STEHIDRAFT_163382 [Stereum hirsutum FP-91666 SS1]|uniref:Uncharacterized protein n=1 Tax=Stereum hirsutum (strain FP-91666) TaxID=721885 RepID=R7RYD5_STEHR|nr:uncharacterized protein STEHIDRAFT_163382 [Stereum hirsutum FP-91666 SS1]EIM79823.1 hypothetical protein STEHIDRAFT_163382 [Stereum hirsutum FP-91666 SS1]